VACAQPRCDANQCEQSKSIQEIPAHGGGPSFRMSLMRRVGPARAIRPRSFLIEVPQSWVANQHSVEATHDPDDEENDNDQTENAAEAGAAVAIVAIIATTTAQQQDQQDNNQNHAHLSHLPGKIVFTQSGFARNYSVAYLKVGSVLSPSFEPPGNNILLSHSLRLS